MNSLERESRGLSWSILTYKKELDAQVMCTLCCRRIHGEFFKATNLTKKPLPVNPSPISNISSEMLGHYCVPEISQV